MRVAGHRRAGYALREMERRNRPSTTEQGGAESGGSRASGFKEPAGARIRPCPPRRRAESPQYHQTQMPEPPTTAPRPPRPPPYRFTKDTRSRNPDHRRGHGYHSLEVFTKTQVPEPPTTAPALPGLRLTGSPKAQMPESPTRQQITKTAPSPPARTTRTGNPPPPIDRENFPPPPSDNHDQEMSDPPIVGPTNKIAKILRPRPRLRRALPRRRHRHRNPSQDAQPLCGRRRPA